MAAQPSSQDGFQLATVEFKKRRREIFWVVFLAVVFVFLTWMELRLLSFSQQLPFVHSIFFFGLVNFNIIILLLLFFLVFRNIVKVFVERRGRVIGSSLKAKLIAAFVAFTSIPTILMFIVSVFYINSSFDKWFSVKMAGVLKNSLEVTNEYYTTAKRKNYHFANEIVKVMSRVHKPRDLEKVLNDQLRAYSLDAVEYYPDLFATPIVATAAEGGVDELPRVSLEFLQKGIRQNLEASMIHQFGEGNLVRVIVPVRTGSHRGALVASSFVPLSLLSKIEDISSAYEDFRNLNPLEYPLKSIYLIILVLMTLMILFCGTWFGVHLARQLSIPLETLGSATQRISVGDYQTVDLVTGSAEVNELIESFNQMTLGLARSEREVTEANVSLRETLDRLDEHTRYVEVVLSNVSTGVISVDNRGLITTINRYAGELLKIEPALFIGKAVKSLLDKEHYHEFSELVRLMQEFHKASIQKEVRILVRGQSVPMQMNLSILQDEKGQEIGKVLVFDDLTPLVNAQRAAAWTEVARRVAHEIKNPLTPIKLSAQRLRKKFSHQISDPAFSTCIDMIIEQTDEMKDLVNEFSNFARLPQARPVLASLDQVLRDALLLYRSSHSEVSFKIGSDSSLPLFEFDPEQMKRVFINLIDNAVAAVEARPDPEVTLNTHYDPVLNIVQVSVADSGPGLQGLPASRLFEPYFSTKKHGTGLGLTIVKRIVEDHNGFVRAQANTPTGLRMVVELPVVAQARKASQQGENING